MFSFDHITERTFENVDAGNRLKLPGNARRETVSVKGKNVVKVYLTERLTVPTTTEDLIAVAQRDSGEVEMETGKGVKTKMTQACADYLRGRKLRSNQEQGAELVGDGKATTRQYALAWFLSKAENLPVYTAKLSTNTPKQMSEWLDSLYAENSQAIDEFAGK